MTNDSLDAAWGDRPRPERWSSRRRGEAWGGGRWSALGPAESGDVDAEPSAVLDGLLVRYGLLNRDLVGRGDGGSGVNWARAYPVLTRREWAGEVERGLFVTGLSAPQFAVRGLIDGLTAPTEDPGPILLNVLDPVCIHGDLFPIERPNGESYVLRHYPGNSLVVRAGRPVLAVENRAERLVPLAEMDRAELREALSTLRRLVDGRHRPPAIRVRSWDGGAIIGSIGAEELERIGFVREDRDMILYRTYGGERAE